MKNFLTASKPQPAPAVEQTATPTPVTPPATIPSESSEGKANDTHVKMLQAYLEAEAQTDIEFAQKWASSGKNAADCSKYLYELHRPKQGGQCVATNDMDDNALAKAFIMDDTKTVNKPSASKQGKKPKQPKEQKKKNVRVCNAESVPAKTAGQAKTATATQKVIEKNIFDFTVGDDIDIFSL